MERVARQRAGQTVTHLVELPGRLPLVEKDGENGRSTYNRGLSRWRDKPIRGEATFVSFVVSLAASFVDKASDKARDKGEPV